LDIQLSSRLTIVLYCTHAGICETNLIGSSRKITSRLGGLGLEKVVSGEQKRQQP